MRLQSDIDALAAIEEDAKAMLKRVGLPDHVDPPQRDALAGEPMIEPVEFCFHDFISHSTLSHLQPRAITCFCCRLA